MSTILVIEDEPIVRNFVVQVLTRENYRVLEADSAAEALDVSNQYESIDLVITDHSLKTMTVPEVVAQLCRSRPHLKVLQMSGYPKEWLLREGHLTEDIAFLPKPFVKASLLAAVRRLLVATQSGTAS